MRLARHKGLIWSGVLVASIVALAAVVGCTMVGDALTGVSVDRRNPSHCLKECVETFDEQVRREVVRHRAEIVACHALPESQREACEAAEAARHQAAMERIAAGRRECMNDCHRQGTGSAG